MISCFVYMTTCGVSTARPCHLENTSFTKNKLKKGFGKFELETPRDPSVFWEECGFPFLPFEIRSRFAPKWIKIFCKVRLGPFLNYLPTKLSFTFFVFFYLGCRREQKLSSLYQQICLKTPDRSTPSTTSIAPSRVSAQSSTKSLLILYLGTE
jgi:hypothetical protein